MGTLADEINVAYHALVDYTNRGLWNKPDHGEAVLRQAIDALDRAAEIEARRK